MSTKGLAFQVQEVHHPKTHQECHGPRPRVSEQADAGGPPRQVSYRR
jgi:hypothetical protein